MDIYLKDQRIRRAIIKYEKTNNLLEKQITYSLLDSIFSACMETARNITKDHTFERRY